MGNYKALFIVLLVGCLALQYITFRLFNETREVKVKMDLVGCKSKVQTFTIPKSSNLNLYSKNGSHYLQYKDVKGYYHTVAYNVLDFNEIE